MERLLGWEAMQDHVVVRREDLEGALAAELIGELNAELSGRYPEEGDQHFRLDAAEVAPGAGAFVVAYVADAPVGCGAVRRIAAEVGEVKRMYVREAARGRQVGGRLLAALEAEARALGIRRLVLETGVRQPEAQALYRRAGFVVIDAFGEYVGSPISVCMGKDL